MQYALLLILAIFPSIVIAVFLYKQDKHEKEEHKHLWGAFGWGALTILPAVLVEEMLMKDGANAFYHAFVVAALTEEFFKFAFLYFLIFPKAYFNEPYDGIIYAAFVSLGFATVENIMYVMDGGLSVAILRMFMAVPGHATWGIFMGFYIGIAKFHPTNKLPYLLWGFVVAVLAHGSYDYFLFQENYKFLALLSVLMIVISIIVSRKAIKLHQDISPFKPENMKPVASIETETEPTNDTLNSDSEENTNDLNI